MIETIPGENMQGGIFDESGEGELSNFNKEEIEKEVENVLRNLSQEDIEILTRMDFRSKGEFSNLSQEDIENIFRILEEQRAFISEQRTTKEKKQFFLKKQSALLDEQGSQEKDTSFQLIAEAKDLIADAKDLIADAKDLIAGAKAQQQQESDGKLRCIALQEEILTLELQSLKNKQKKDGD